MSVSQTVATTGALEPLSMEKLQEQLAQLQAQTQQIQGEMPDNRVSIVLFSGDLDKAFASFVIATGAAASGMEVSMFFTFWGLSPIKARKSNAGKSFLQKMFSWMLPAGPQGLGISKMNFGGIGSRLMRVVMRQNKVVPLEQMIEMAKQLGVKMTACQMSMEVMGITKEELMNDIEVGGVAAFLADATRSKSSLFI